MNAQRVAERRTARQERATRECDLHRNDPATALQRSADPDFGTWCDAFPDQVMAVFREFRTCELATRTRDGSPVCWPTVPLYQPLTGTFLITTSIGFPQKVHHIRRDPRVALLFSDSTGSGLDDPPTVLVQGDATVSDEVVTWSPELEDMARHVYPRQPDGCLCGKSWMVRWLFDLYCMRLLIHVTPRHARWWPGGQLDLPPRELVIDHAA